MRHLEDYKLYHLLSVDLTKATSMSQCHQRNSLDAKPHEGTFAHSMKRKGINLSLLTTIYTSNSAGKLTKVEVEGHKDCIKVQC